MKIAKIALLTGLVAVLVSWTFINPKDEKSFKCLVQLTNYQGEGAYMVISLIAPDGKYEQTLYVMGEDEKWYPDLTEWWKAFEKRKAEVDGVSGATVSGGGRTVCVLNIEDSKIDAGYKLRFETAVEDQEYYVADVEFPLTAESTTGKFDGQGYIRYVRLIPN